jgi:hypothetical protein
MFDSIDTEFDEVPSDGLLSLKTLAQRQPPGSPEQVVLHGFWQKRRGRKPAMSFAGEKNPARAYARALEELGLYNDTISTIQLRTRYDPDFQLNAP